MAKSLELDRTFAALADPTRRRILEGLAKRSMTVGEIAERFTMSQPGISKHVKVLEEAGLLEREIVGRTHHCRLNPAPMSAAGTWLDEQRAFWNATLDRLEAYVNTAPSRRKR
jgi:DNA-binding transcriptional ArsR family regulator